MANATLTQAPAKNIGDPISGPSDPAIADALFSGGLTPTTLTYTGNDAAIGLLPDGFAISEVGGGEVVSIDRGVFLSTGGDPGTSNTESSFTVSYGAPGDPLLDAAAQDAFSGAGTTGDAALITFTFEASDLNGAPSISFDLFFGSEEYPEFADGLFVDIAAVFVNGVNYALFNNDPEQPLSIVGPSINTPGNFFDNEEFDTPERDGTYDTEYDGFSTRLTVVAPVQPGTNEVVIGIADTGDLAWDSGLFVGNVQGSNFAVGGSFVDVQGTASNDDIQTNEAPELIELGGGQDTVSGTPDQLDGDVINGFGNNDTLIIEGVGLGADDIDITMGSAILDIDTDGDGSADTNVTLLGGFDEAEFTVTSEGGNTQISASGVSSTPGVSLLGTDGPDTLIGGDGPDTLLGGDGDDRLEGLGAGDVLEGGAGDDGILGGDGNDVMSGGDGNDNMAAADGNDQVDGDAGNDFMGGGFGDDIMDGGTGDDFMGGGQGDDVMLGGDDNDVVNGGAGSDILNGGSGNDTMGASFNNDTVVGGTGDDDMGGGTGSDEIRAGAGDDAVGGGEGNDTIAGGSGNDFLAGGGRDDDINGGTGMDTINAGTGDDTVAGGEDADIFVFNTFLNGEVDTITDFENGIDILRLRGVSGGFDGLDIGTVSGGAAIRYEGHTIVLEGVSAADLGADDFSFV